MSLSYEAMVLANRTIYQCANVIVKQTLSFYLNFLTLYVSTQLSLTTVSVHN